MVTINVSEETKERFKKLKLQISAQKKESISEDNFLIQLLNKFEGLKCER